MNRDTPFKKPLREKLMNLCGMYRWLPTHNDPRIKGPQPRLITIEQARAMERFQKGNEEAAENEVAR